MAPESTIFFIKFPVQFNILGAGQSDLSQYELKLTWNDNIQSSHSIPSNTADPPRNSRRLHNTQQVRWLAANGLNYQGQRQFCVHVNLKLKKIT